MQSNTLTVVGNVGDDPELRFTNSAPPHKFSLAVYAGKRTGWHPGLSVTVWGQLAENVAESVTALSGRCSAAWSSSGGRTPGCDKRSG